MSNKCVECGNTIYNEKIWGSGLIVKDGPFCSGGCKRKWNNAKAASNQSNSSSNKSGNSFFASSSDEPSAETLAQKRLMEMQIEERDKERRIAKADILKEKGRPFQSFVTEHINHIGTGLLVIFVGLLSTILLMYGNQAQEHFGVIVGIPLGVIALISCIGLVFYVKEFKNK